MFEGGFQGEKRHQRSSQTQQEGHGPSLFAVQKGGQVQRAAKRGQADPRRGSAPCVETESRFLFKSGVLMQYLGHEEEVTIPDSCTAIGVRAFKDQTQLRRVVVPKSVKDIGERAFEGCPRLTDITLSRPVWPGLERRLWKTTGGNRHPCPGGQLCGAVRQGEQHQVSDAVKKRGACV